jgi:galactose mutarotase-like enzyme
MDIELYNGETKAIISTHGGYVTNLSDSFGDVLFPKRTLKTSEGVEKLRGGSHVCLPNFGPGGDSGQEQHGYGRMSEWSVVDSSAEAASLKLEGEGVYAGLIATLNYQVGDQEFTSILTLKNTSGAAFHVAPAFHPYFMHTDSIEVDGDKKLLLDDFKDAIFIDGTKHILRTGTRLITLLSDNLPKWAQWTDQLGSYFCLEPTQSGFAFSEDMTRADVLEPGESKTYRFVIGWSSPLEN